MEKFNELTSSPLSCDESPEQQAPIYRETVSKESETPSKSLCVNFNEQPPDAVSSEFSTPNKESCSDSPPDSQHRPCEEAINLITSVKLPMTGAFSPLRQRVSFCCSVSSVPADHSSETLVPEFQRNMLSEKLFPGSSTSADDATVLTNLFCSKFSLTDECSNTLCALIKVLLPDENKFPSGFSRIKKIKNNFENSVRVMLKDPGITVCVLNYRFQLGEIVKRYLNEILRYSETRKQNPNKDLHVSFCPAVQIEQNNFLDINLILFTDGVNIKKSTFKKEVWPIWVQISDLPPKLRSARENIVLAALAIDDSYPSWHNFVPDLKHEIATRLTVDINDEVSYKVRFDFRLLIADLGAKNHVLNMMQFNGFYGCHYCTAKSSTIGRTHAYYPYNQPGQIRESCINEIHVSTAETLGVKKITNVAGVKGKVHFLISLAVCHSQPLLTTCTASSSESSLMF